MYQSSEKNKGILIAVIVISAIGMFVNIWTGANAIRLIGFYPSTLIVYLLCVMLYISIIKYTYDCFFKGKKVTITSMLMRYCAALASFIIGVSAHGMQILLVPLAILILVPFMAGDLSKIKRDRIIVFVVLGLSFALGILRIVIVPDTILPYVCKDFMDYFTFYFLSFNMFIQWGLFSIIYLVRSSYTLKNPEKKEEDERQKI